MYKNGYLTYIPYAQGKLIATKFCTIVQDGQHCEVMLSTKDVFRRWFTNLTPNFY